MINSPRVCVQVQSVYIESQSSPQEERYVFAYTVTIRNLGRTQVQLLGRYWLITNGHGRETEVQGEGVVGEQPHIPAGGEYQYTSGAVIETPLGTHAGTLCDDRCERRAVHHRNPCFPSRSTHSHPLKHVYIPYWRRSRLLR